MIAIPGGTPFHDFSTFWYNGLSPIGGADHVIKGSNQPTLGAGNGEWVEWMGEISENKRMQILVAAFLSKVAKVPWFFLLLHFFPLKKGWHFWYLFM